MIEPHELCRWLEERKVVSIHRTGDEVRLELETVRRDEPVRRVRIRLMGVTAESARYFVGERVTAPHPDPTSPLDLIEMATYQDSKLVLGGYLAGEPWYEWELSAADIAVERGNDVPAA